MSKRVTQTLSSSLIRRRSDDVGPETDDWTTATDPRAKKRIQNRLAQRNYRYRLKKRLEGLEQQVQDYEDNISPDDTISNQKVDRSFAGSSTSFPDRNMQNKPSLNSVVIPPHFFQNNPGMSSSTDILGSQQLSALNSNLLNLSPDFAASMGHINLSLGVTDPGQYPQNPSDGFSLDSVALANRWQIDKDLNSTNMADVAAILEYNQAEVDYTPIEAESSTTSQSSTSSQLQTRPTKAARSRPSLSLFSSSDGDNDEALHIPAKAASAEDRIEYVMSCAKNVGFDSLDALIIAYYAQDFSQESAVSDEQRMSRHRGLPQVLAELRQTSANWTQWERNGYEDEILRAAEGICAVECSRFIQTDSQVNESIHGAYPCLTQRTFQAHLPRLWALLTSLTSGSMSISTRDRAIVVFASMLLPCYWGRVPRSQIFSWLKACINQSRQNSSGDFSITIDL